MPMAESTNLLPPKDESTQSSLIIRNAGTVALHRDYGPGTFMGKLYSGFGEKIGKEFDKLAQGLNIGPEPIAQHIQNAFGVQEQRLLKLKELHGSNEAARKNLPITKDCSKLLKYTLCTEAPETRLQAFNCIILVLSLYPGLRQSFLMDKIFKRVGVSQEGILTLWKDDESCSTHWEYKRDLAVAFFCEDEIGALVETPRPERLGYVDGNGSHSAIESLVAIIDCDGAMKHTGAIAIRYLGGILQLPTFWLKPYYSSHSSVMTKLLRGLAAAVKDIGVDTTALEKIEPTTPNYMLDLQGVDYLVEAVFMGIFKWSEQIVLPESPSWGENLIILVKLLHGPKVKDVLPQSWSQLSSNHFRKWFPTTTSVVLCEEYVDEAPLDGTPPTMEILEDRPPTRPLSLFQRINNAIRTTILGGGPPPPPSPPTEISDDDSSYDHRPSSLLDHINAATHTTILDAEEDYPSWLPRRPPPPLSPIAEIDYLSDHRRSSPSLEYINAATRTTIVGDSASPTSSTRSGTRSNIVEDMLADDISRPAHARYSFDGLGEGELPMLAGAEVEVLDDRDSAWWYARDIRTGREGVVPAAYLY